MKDRYSKRVNRLLSVFLTIVATLVVTAIFGCADLQPYVPDEAGFMLKWISNDPTNASHTISCVRTN